MDGLGGERTAAPGELDALRRELAQARAELRQAQARQAAAADVLKIVSRSSADVAPVFDAIMESCFNLFGPYGAAIYLVEGGLAVGVARRGFVDGEFGADATPLAGSMTGRSIAARAPVHIPDLGDLPHLPEHKRANVRATGGLSVLYAPMLAGERGVGSLVVARRPKQPFTDSEIAAIAAFADQAVVAIENARLFGETQEALRQQTATADVLKAISRSVFDPQAVLETLINSAVALSGSSHGLIWRYEDGAMHARAFAHGEQRDDFIAHMRANPQKPGRGSAVARIALTGEVVNIADMNDDPDFPDHLKRVIVTRATLGVPMKRGDELVGAVVMSKPGAGAYPERIVELVKSFADQAVIAIENARLFGEVQARTREVEQALARQTATADILKVIASSPADAGPVFEAIAASANAAVRGWSTGVYRFIEGQAHLMAMTSTSPQGDAVLRAAFPLPLADFPPFAYVSDGGVSEIPDTELSPEPRIREIARARGYRSMAFVPLAHRGEVIGLLSVTRAQPAAFSQADIAQMQAFADQAVIAIQNARLFEEVTVKTRDLENALERQTATSEILRAIAGAPGDADRALQFIAETSARLFAAPSVSIQLAEGVEFVREFRVGAIAQRVGSAYPRSNIKVGGRSLPGVVVGEARQIHIPDLDHLDPAMADFPGLPHARAGGARTVCGTPLRRDGAAIGALIVFRNVLRPFTPEELALLQTFADQAVIAVENARLFEEVRARTRDLEEALAQQTATADVLKVISRSVFDLDAVLQTLIDTAVRLARGSRGTIFLRDGEVLRARAFHSQVPAALRDYLIANPIELAGDEPISLAVRQGRLVHVPDMAAYDSERVRETRRLAGFGSALWVPLLRDGEVIGIFGVPREQPIPFNEREIELVRSFADQAVIAIENARLLGEVQARTRELQDSLERQNANAEILRAISASPTDSRPVFDVIVQTAARLFGCQMAGVFWRQGDMLVPVTGAWSDRLFLPDELSPPLPVDAHANYPSRALLGRRTFRAAYDGPDTPEHERFIRDHYGIASALFLPLTRDDECVGVFLLTSDRPRAFDDRDVTLAESFRDQANIAMQNARLFEQVQARTREIEESLAQQTATADVLKVISRSVFDLQSVFDTLLTRAVELVGGVGGAIALREGDKLRMRAGASPRGLFGGDFVGRLIEIDRVSAAGRAMLTGRTAYIPDAARDPEFHSVRSAGWGKSYLAAPLSRDGRTEGALTLIADRADAFTPRQIELIETFADQAVIAIENARLFDEVQARTRELEQSLDDLRKAQDRLVQSEKLASLGQLTAGIAHEIKNPLNFVNNFASLSRDLVAELKEVLGEKADAEVEELTGLIDSNLEKVVHHGKRADSIVKNMLLHSREGSGERARVNVNAMVEEALNLAYHGARAEKPGFNVDLQRAFDPEAGEADLYLQEITRVLLNLIGNGFYAAAKRREAEGPDYQPTLTAATRGWRDAVEIRIRDNGTGIPQEVRAKMFNPFFTTKPAGEGTGLGLSLSHDIVVKQHGGTLDVETEPGAFTEFVITLPRQGVRS